MEHVQAAAKFAGIELSSSQIVTLGRYADWLRSEGQHAGGIGPEEADRVERRHLADSLLFAGYLPHASEVWDLGTGVGLPGVPLAIALPDTRFVLVDRSRRRIDLLRRISRILDLGNCLVVHGEIESLRGPIQTLVSRASLPPEKMIEVAQRLLDDRGRVIMGGSWTKRPEHPGWETIEIPGYVLDQPVWLLIMRRE